MAKKNVAPLAPIVRESSTTSTRRDISLVVAETHRIPQALAYEIVGTTFEALLSNIFENKHVELRGFGVFEMTEHKGRTGRNPKKPTDEVWIPPRKTIKFRASKLLRGDLLETQIAEYLKAKEEHRKRLPLTDDEFRQLLEEQQRLNLFPQKD